ncbi:hypothetical protein [Fusobacterium periodonticum]|uniref:Uncharacterized protein n=1 Tax=Fusobacterium periodonticum ATCC 33693 TaxID=546275 RepID=D4CXT3_9FUSO|nr:hypothetical protein [Fusobacterium periodonticum]EFE85832.1 hypothetical protein FUSPEROL_02190 [Fusobacterium periodonticum ATCC 33693]
MKLLNMFNWFFNRNNNNAQSIVNSIIASNNYIAEKLAYLNQMYFKLKLTYPVEFFYNELLNEIEIEFSENFNILEIEKFIISFIEDKLEFVGKLA